MDRQIVYVGAIPQDLDLLNTNKNTMLSIGMALQAVLGAGTWVDGLACTPTSPASLQVLVAQGSIYSVGNVDGTAYGSISSDTAHQIVKQGIVIGNTTFTITVPSTTGQSINYLIQAEYQDVDGGSTVLPYYNASNPAVAYNGPNNTGVSQNTLRQGKCILSLKPGISANTGTQVTPTPDAGFTGLWVVTVANGATTIVSGNISPYSGSTTATGSAAAWSGPLMLEKLNYKVSIATGDLRWQAIGGGGGARTRLTNNTNYYVATTGNDSNPGTSGSPWLTIQNAINFIADSVDLAGFTATINVAAGTYSSSGVSVSGPFTGMGNVILNGNTTTPSNVVLASSGSGILVSNAGELSVQGLKITTTGGDSIIARHGGIIYISGKMEFGACSHFHISSNSNGIIDLGGTAYNITGGGVAHFGGTAFGTIIADGCAVTISGSPSFTDAFLEIQQAMIRAVSFTYSGTATAPQQYLISMNATVYIQGATVAGYFPGTTAGTPSTGGQIA